MIATELDGKIRGLNPIEQPAVEPGASVPQRVCHWQACAYELPTVTVDESCGGLWAKAGLLRVPRRGECSPSKR